jgi:protoporphyrinogen oxidase
MTLERHPTLIVGGGLTGISAALHLKNDYVLAERDDSLGGLARTDEKQGFYFDRTGHWLHLRDPEMMALVARLPGLRWSEVERISKIYSHGRFIQYPFQSNFHGLPKDVVFECLHGYVEALVGRQAEAPRNFEEYVLHHFGKGIAEHFMIPYNSKLWGVHPREITSAWCSRFLPIPSREQVLAGAIGAGKDNVGYNVRFRYPEHGGIGAFSAALAAELDPQRVNLNTSIEKIDHLGYQLQMGGESVDYHALITTMPLPKLIDTMDDVPGEVLKAVSQLRATSVRYLDVATRKPPPQDYHWVYTPEMHLPFYRVGVYSNAVPSMAPAGCASLYVELSDRDAPADQEAATAEALRALVEIGAIGAVEDVVFADLREIEVAYVIFDEHYEASLKCIFEWLESRRIYSCGRYGAWIYNSMEDSLLAGKAVAEHVDALAVRTS